MQRGFTIFSDEIVIDDCHFIRKNVSTFVDQLIDQSVGQFVFIGLTVFIFLDRSSYRVYWHCQLTQLIYHRCSELIGMEKHVYVFTNNTNTIINL